MLKRFKHQGVWEKLHTLKFIYNYRVKTVALIICFKKRFVQVCAIPEVVSNPQLCRSIDIGIWTRDPSYQIGDK